MKHQKNFVKCALLVICFLTMPYFALAASYGKIQGMVTDAITGEPVIDAIIKLDSGGSALSRPPDGSYIIIQEPGLWHMTVEAEGYCKVDLEIILCCQNETINLDITLTPLTDILKGDNNGNRELDLADAIIALQITASINSDLLIQTSCADVNGDNKIGLEEAVYVIQGILGLKSNAASGQGMSRRNF